MHRTARLPWPSVLSSLAYLRKRGRERADELPGGAGREMGDQTCPGPAHLFHRELDPKVVAKLAIVQCSHNPGDLGALRVVCGVVVATVVGKLLHACDVEAAEAELTKAYCR